MFVWLESTVLLYFTQSVLWFVESENNRCKFERILQFVEHEWVFSAISFVCSLPIQILRHFKTAAHRFCTNTTCSHKAWKTNSITKGLSSSCGCREKWKAVSGGGKSQLSDKASSICIHRHGYCLQWASPCWQGERWREGKWLLGNSHITKGKPKPKLSTRTTNVTRV